MGPQALLGAGALCWRRFGRLISAGAGGPVSVRGGGRAIKRALVQPACVTALVGRLWVASWCADLLRYGAALTAFVLGTLARP